MVGRGGGDRGNGSGGVGDSGGSGDIVVYGGYWGSYIESSRCKGSRCGGSTCGSVGRCSQRPFPTVQKGTVWF